MSRPEIVVFDLGGVLIDWNPRHLYRKIFAGDEERIGWFLREVCPPEWNAGMDAGRPFADGIAERIALFPEFEAEIRAFIERWPEMLGGPITGTVTLFEALGERGIPRVALSNWSAETFAITRSLPEYRFLDRFERLFISGELGMVKPDPAIFRHALAELGVPAGACLFVDDVPANVATAETVGFRTHLFRSPEALAEELRRLQLLP
jgi:2-haloacid dehalogenase